MSKIIKLCPICEEQLNKLSDKNIIDLSCNNNISHTFWIRIDSKLNTHDSNKIIMCRITWNKFPKLFLHSDRKCFNLMKISHSSSISLIHIPKFRISLNKDAIEDLFNKLIVLHKFQ
jgi:hypothetical protein